MDIYNIKDTYIEFIRTYDNRVADNKNESRPYIGIILLIGNIKYYAPFTSPKPKHEVSTPMRGIAPIEVVSKTEQSSEKYLQELPIKGFVFETVPLSSLEHKTDEPYVGRANKGLFTKPPIHWQMMPKEYFGLCFAFKARA